MRPTQRVVKIIEFYTTLYLVGKFLAIMLYLVGILVPVLAGAVLLVPALRNLPAAAAQGAGRRRLLNAPLRFATD